MKSLFTACLGSATTADLFVGIALDGNPIYGPKIRGKEALLKSADLDACHGQFVDGKYRYHITADFPYAIGCFKSEPARGNIGSGDMKKSEPPTPIRSKRQTKEDATCSNKDYAADLCDCTTGTMTACDTLLDKDKDTDANSCTKSGTRQHRALLTFSALILMIVTAMLF